MQWPSEKSRGVAPQVVLGSEQAEGEDERPGHPDVLSRVVAERLVVDVEQELLLRKVLEE